MRLSLQLAPVDARGLNALADAVGAPGDPKYGHTLERAALAERLAPTPAQRGALQAWFAGAGLTAQAGGLGEQRWSTVLGRAALVRLVGEEATRTLLARRCLRGEAARAVLPPMLASLVDAIEVGPDAAPAATRVLVDPGVDIAYTGAGLTPAALARGYEFGPEHDGEGECIAVMALGGVPSAADLHGFARAFGLPAPQVELVPLTPLGACADDPRFRFETTMGLQWLAAVAPRARIVVYLIDPGVAVDPWAEFLFAVLSDMSRRPSIAVTSWSAPARQYYAVHGRSRFAGLLDQAALAGITVIAASGDWGAYDGFPSAGPGRDLCDELAPHVTFPGAEPRVLSVGGTQVTETTQWREVAWSAPVSPALHAATGLAALAGGGGVSEDIPVPDYQRTCLPASLSRGADVPAITPTGRVQPDVALMAWGPGATAYACLLGGEWRDDAGGTSVAAPIWAALIARINQARGEGGHPRLGQLQPRLYGAPGLLRDITEGCTDITLPIAGPDGTRTWQRLPGFEAVPGFDAATGLGAPDVQRLMAQLAASR